MSQTKYKLNIFETLNKISKKDASYFNQLSVDEQNSLQPLVVMRWLTGTDNARQIFFLNELVNPFVFALTNHKELLVHLMTVCCSNRNGRYKWKKLVNTKTSKYPMCNKIIQQFFGYSSKDAKEAFLLLDDDTIISYAEQLGTQTIDIRAIKKELRLRIK